MVRIIIGMKILKKLFRTPYGDLTKLSESEQLTYQVFQDILEHGKAPAGKILMDLILAQHIEEDPETGTLGITESGFRFIAYLERKALAA